MTSQAPIWIISGDFGRATVNVTDRALVEHVHQQFNLLFMLGGANTVFRSGAAELPLDEGSLLLFNPWVPHLKLANTDGPTMILSMIIETRWIDHVLESQGLQPGLVFPHMRETMTDDVRIYAERLAAAIPRDLMSGKTSCEGLVADLISAVVSAYIAPEIERTPASDARPIDFRIRKALVHIHAHAHENPRIDDIARMVGLSRSRFFEQFRRCVGASPQHYIDHIRMKTATRWLSTSERPLVELADELGFGAHSNFTRFLRSIWPCHPANSAARPIVSRMRRSTTR
jgi:AraC-like DNA-binding protein